jgi:putative spermidine/putrescine transport system ATP-binding protein
MRTEIRRIHQQLGLTTVYVTHDQEEALSLADRLVVLRDGRVEQVGPPEELYTEPANRYVAGFMGYRNLLELNIVGVAGERLQLEGHGLALTGIDRDDVAGQSAGVVAIRPEDFVVGAGEGGVDVTVEVVEYQGRELAVQVRTADGTSLHLRTTERLAPGDQVAIAVPPERVLVFNADSPAAPDEVAA